ncbi:MAG TPA: DUF3347 domain-containing protein [Bacteroidia bacterium]|nr:DUF3347 domain-containing protein [Bacteroidia bacterium]
MKKIAIIIALVAGIFATATAQDTAIKDFGNASKTFKKQLNKSLLDYYDLKDALVAANSADAKKYAKLFISTFNKIDTAALTTDQRKYFRTNAEYILKQAAVIETDTDIEHQRECFEEVSIYLYALAKSFKANDATVYRQYCPMAFNDKGAYWLSSDPEIMNPYFGDEMLHCGRVREEF